MAASERRAVRNRVKVRLPQLGSRTELIEAESKKGNHEIYSATLEGGRLRNFRNSCPNRERKTCANKVVENDSNQLEMFITEMPNVEFISPDAHKRERSVEVDGRKMKRRRTNTIEIESSNCSSGLSFTSCEEDPYTEMSKQEKRGAIVARVDKIGTGKSMGGQIEKKQILDCKKRLDCSIILRKLMSHQSAWIFNEPVNPRKFNIPDYFTIITKPMDLGTVKRNLRTKSYLDSSAFAGDVRLTFSNAMLYNPPDDDVHRLAQELNSDFESLWKAVQAKWISGSSMVAQKPILDKRSEEAQALRKGGPKEDAPSNLNALPKILLPLSLRTTMRKDITEILKGKVSADVLNCLRRSGLIDQMEEKIHIDIDAFDDDKLSKWHKIIKPYLDSKPATSVLVKKSGGNGSIQKKLYNGACAHTTPNTKVVACVDGGSIDNQSIGQNELFRSSSSGRVRCANKSAHPAGSHNLDPLANGIGGQQIITLDPNANDGRNVKYSAPPATPVTPVACEEVEVIDDDGQMTPEKALRAAMLKRRFADTIVRAKHNKLLCNGEKGDSVKMQKEKEILEKKQQQAKIRVASEVALRRSREMELKMQRQREREIARIALEKMEKTVEIYENLEILKDIEKLECCQVFGSSIVSPLKKLGLFLKADYAEEEEEEDVVNFNSDLEDGEILP
ncbi:hypothetical protein MKW94_008576 [Papaver nudicaule]|uniref:Bromo domain-containing protein n=1 Tax=Papaver nudicaule TaxID=74823 RepID=A0AA42B444_PAPNU|nr:hypothetical protein [Papaver nudicaule]